MRKEIEMCDNFEDEKANYKIVKGKDKGLGLCDYCFETWKDDLIEEYYEVIGGNNSRW